jgi:hypothetical protein
MSRRDSRAGTSFSSQRPKPKPEPKPDVKPVEIFELRVKTQQMVLRTRRIRTQIGRVSDLILARETAINKTHEQQTEVPAVNTDHSRTIGHVQRSVECASNALEALKEDLNKVINDDRTFIVKELEEEGRLGYCENLRLNARLVDSRAEAAHSEQLLEFAALRASEANKKELESQIRATRRQIADLLDKASRYSVKRQKIEIEKTILGFEASDADPDDTTEQCEAKRAELEESIQSCNDSLAEEQASFESAMTELQEIVEGQRAAIVEHLRATA